MGTLGDYSAPIKYEGPPPRRMPLWLLLILAAAILGAIGYWLWLQVVSQRQLRHLQVIQNAGLGVRETDTSGVSITAPAHEMLRGEQLGWRRLDDRGYWERSRMRPSMDLLEDSVASDWEAPARAAIGNMDDDPAFELLLAHSRKGLAMIDGERGVVVLNETGLWLPDNHAGWDFNGDGQSEIVACKSSIRLHELTIDFEKASDPASIDFFNEDDDSGAILYDRSGRQVGSLDDAGAYPLFVTGDFDGDGSQDLAYEVGEGYRGYDDLIAQCVELNGPDSRNPDWNDPAALSDFIESTYADTHNWTALIVRSAVHGVIGELLSNERSSCWAAGNLRVADVDGDGADEFIYDDDGIPTAVGLDGERASLRASPEVYPSAAADLDGDGVDELYYCHGDPLLLGPLMNELHGAAMGRFMASGGFDFERYMPDFDEPGSYDPADFGTQMARMQKDMDRAMAGSFDSGELRKVRPFYQAIKRHATGWMAENYWLSAGQFMPITVCLRSLPSEQAVMEVLAAARPLAQPRFGRLDFNTGEHAQFAFPPEMNAANLFLGTPGQLGIAKLSTDGEPLIFALPDFGGGVFAFNASGQCVYYEELGELVYSLYVLKGPDHDWVLIELEDDWLIYP